MTTPLDRVLQTARLILRPLTLDDAAAIFVAFQDAETMRFMEQPIHLTVAQTYAHLTNMLTAESCWWALVRKDTDDESAIGYVGYLGNTAVPGMGYLLRRDHWRQGFMTEAVKAALQHGFTTLSLERVELWINDGNLASQGVAKAVGFTRRSQFRMKYPHNEHGHDKVVYGLYRYEWMARPEPVAVRPRACYGIQPILAVADVQVTVDFYCHQLDFTVDFLVGDPPTYGAVV